MHRRTLVSALALAAAAGAVGAWWPRGEGALPLLAAQAQGAPAADPARVVEMTLGSPDAKVEVVEYASFTCPHCANFHANVFGKLKANYIDTGKIRFIYREVYFDRYGLWAATVARCGDGQRYFGIADMLYTKQREWLASGEPAGIAEALRTIGKTAGLTAEQVDQCLSDEGMLQSLVAVYQENAQRDGVDSTPTFLIDGQKYPNMSYEDFAKVLDEKLAG